MLKNLAKKTLRGLRRLVLRCPDGGCKRMRFGPHKVCELHDLGVPRTEQEWLRVAAQYRH